jgi:hypothetical protein
MRHRLACMLLALTLAAGCGTGGTLQPNEISAVRVYNAVPDSPPLNFKLRGAQLTSGLAYGFGRFYVYANAGNATLDVENNVGDILLDYPTTLAGGVAYTFAVTGTLTSLKPVFLVDDTTAAPAGNFKIRLIHLAPLGPAMDLYITGPTDDIATATPVVTGLSYANASTYVTAPAGSARLRLTGTGSKTVLRDVGTFTFNSGQGVSVFLIGNAGAGGGGAPYSSQVVADHAGR